MLATVDSRGEEPGLAAPAPRNEVVLRTHGLSRSFGGFKAVDGVSLELRRGEIYGFLGRNGAGKTTTLRLLMGILRPDGGEVELLGERARRTTVAQKRRLGYVSQEQVFYPWMTAEQLGRFVGDFYATWDAKGFTELLRLLDVPRERKVAQLSGGTRMKLALALALAHRPEVLLLDEPTAGLDPVARREFLDILVLRCREQGQTALFSSHLVSEVEQVAQRIGIIQDGQLRYQGPLSELRASVRRLRPPPPAPPVVPPPVDTFESGLPGTEASASVMPTAEASASVMPAAEATASVMPTAEATASVTPTAEASASEPLPPEAPVDRPPVAEVPAVEAAPAPVFPPEGFTVIRREGDSVIAFAEPSLWESAHQAARVEPLSLEDIFLAYARKGGA